MSFASFIQTVCDADPLMMDNHVRPQSEMLTISNKLVPKFVGRMEHINGHWRQLRRRMRLEELPTLGALPLKNVRRNGRRDIRELFHSPKLIDQVLEFYQQDFEWFYGSYSVDSLLTGEDLKKLPPLQSGRKGLRLHTTNKLKQAV